MVEHEQATESALGMPAPATNVRAEADVNYAAAFTAARAILTTSPPPTMPAFRLIHPAGRGWPKGQSHALPATPRKTTNARFS
jgi:hypothetical protein